MSIRTTLLRDCEWHGVVDEVVLDEELLLVGRIGMTG